MSFSADVIHYGHIKIMKEAAQYGNLIIGVLTDDVIAQYKRPPLVSFENRCKIFEDLNFVSAVVKKDTLSYENIIREYHPDYIVHGDDWKSGIKASVRKEVIELLKIYGGELIELPYNMEEDVQLLETSMKKQYSMPEIRRGTLKRLLNTRPFVRVMEAHDGLTGLIVENTVYHTEDGDKEFDAMWESSLCDSTSRGKPDIELIDWSERISRISEIMDVTTKPIIVDGDTGGESERFSYIVQNLERIGVSAVIIEDKIGPKRNSLFGTAVPQTQDTSEHFAEKITRAKSALKTHDFMIIARIESLILEQGVEDALSRAEKYVMAGADGIMIHSKSKTPDEIYDFCERFRKQFHDIPIVVVPTTYNNITEEELSAHGANVIIHANHLIRSAFPAMERAAMEILKNGCSQCVDDVCMPVKKIISFIPVNEEKI
mgnify:CR=1 FL=1